MLAEDHAAYGIRDGKLLFIAEVPSGLACECVCVGCGLRLIAKKGPKRRHHFAHLEIAECRGAPETVLHRLSKELLAELDGLEIPRYEFTRMRKTKAGGIVQHQAIVANGGRVPVHSVKVEETEEGFVPDIIIEAKFGSKSKFLVIEVAVSSKVTRAKLRRMRKRDLAAIEIRLDPSDSFRSRESLKEKLQCDLASKVWLFHPDQRDAERTFVSKWRDAIARDRIWSRTRRKGSPARALPSSRSASASHSRPAWNEHDRTQEDFHREHGRYPTRKECLDLWPHLWRKLEP